MSAIPWIGQDIVESIIITIFIIYLLNFIFFSSDLLPTIGNVNKNAFKKGNKYIRSFKQEYYSIPTSFLVFLVGLIDGDGYIQISQTQKGFITIKLTISLHLKDISTLEYIFSVLKLGKININKDLKSPICKLVINKTDLQEVLFPLLTYKKIFFLTKTRIDQFNLAMNILKQDIKLYKDIPKINNLPPVFELPKNPLDYTLLYFFKNWIVGFICPWLYSGVVQFTKENPFIYKRVKRDLINIVSRKEEFNYLKQILKQQ